MDLHLAACLIDGRRYRGGDLAVRILEEAIEHGEGELTDISLSILRHAASGAARGHHVTLSGF